MRPHPKHLPLLVLLICVLPGRALAQAAGGLPQDLAAAAQAYQTGRYGQSIRYDQAALKIDPKSAAAYQGWGDCDYRLGRTADALKEFDRALALDPSNADLARFIQGLRARAAGGDDAAGQGDERAIEDQIDDIESEMFQPHWTASLGMVYSGQPSQTGGGQSQGELDFTGTDNLAESGSYFSAGAGAGRQKLEGGTTNFGKAVLGGGVGWGIFLPTLSLQLERGESALNSNSLTAGFNFQVLDSLSLGLSLGGTLESHDGPASLVAGNSGTTVEVDDRDGSVGASATYAPWDFLGLTLAGSVETDDTYQIQGLKHQVKISLNQSVQTDSISLMADLTLLGDWDLQLTGQAGVEDYPAGTVYSPVQGKTITFSQPTSEAFKGYSFALLYDFQ
jgi:Tetratricopeptide repeat